MPVSSCRSNAIPTTERPLADLQRGVIAQNRGQRRHVPVLGTAGWSGTAGFAEENA